MRFALQLGPTNWLRNGVEATIELVLRAEAGGFDSVWASEDPDGWDAFAALSTLAVRTERIALGTGVTNPYLRHPNLIAASVATLDRASGGRAFLGLGRGEPDWYRTAFGMAIGSPLRRVEETVGLLRQWWGANQVATGSGEIEVRAWRRAFGPVARPPIYIAATGPRMQTLAGRVADGMRLNTLGSIEFIRDAVATASATRPSESNEPFRIFAHPALALTRTSSETERELERRKSAIALIHVLPGMHQQLKGLESRFPVDQILADVRRVMHTDEVLKLGGSFTDLRRAGDLAAARRIIPLDLVREVAVVGTIDEVKPRILEYAKAGVTDVFVDPAQVADADFAAELSAL